ncbi:MAG TPA: hypothetical protein VMV69_28650 [Pirellulales bacterium]|nr:hypothetical protein [Pirellulales bacterium]
MKRNSSRAAWSGAIALVVLACGGIVSAGAAEKVKGAANANDGAAYNPWAGYGGGYGGGYGNGGYGNGAMGYAGSTYNDTGLNGYGATGGYGGGTCCNGVWDGYCAEKRPWCEIRVKHRKRPLGCGAGPYCPNCRDCPNGRGHAAFSPAAPVYLAAPGMRRWGPHHRGRQPCVHCAPGAEGEVEDRAATVETDSPAAEPTVKPAPDAPN